MQQSTQTLRNFIMAYSDDNDGGPRLPSMADGGGTLSVAHAYMRTSRKLILMQNATELASWT